jgi:hypothetical protein
MNDVHVEGGHGRALDHSREAADQHEFDATGQEAVQQRFQI